MSYRKFKFLSPGIFIKEIDNSQLPAEPTAMGPALIGKFQQGPALKPIQVNSMVEFTDIFGNPTAGETGDVWRLGNNTAPTYAAYAAQAWLRNNSPVTIVRLLGQTNSNATTNTGYAGWATTQLDSNTTAASNGGAYGLFLCEGPSASFVTESSASGPDGGFDASMATEGTLAAVWYLNNGAIALSGQSVDPALTSDKGFATFIRAVDSGPTFKVIVQDSSDNTVIDSSFNFDETSPRFIRKVFNTNPTLTNSNLTPTGGTTLNYWLGESFAGNLKSFKGTNNTNARLGISGSVPASCYGVILRLATPDGSTLDGGDFRMSSTKSPSKQFSKTGWFISQDVTSDTASYQPGNMQRLFRLCARELGEETQRKVKISIKNIRAADPDAGDAYGSFTVLVRRLDDLDSAPKILEQYNNCNLNPASDQYIAKKIGNKFDQWNDDDRRYRRLGEYENVSDYVYVETNELVDSRRSNPVYLPFGVYGPPRYLGFAVSGTSAKTYDFGTVPTSGGIFVETGSDNPINAAGSPFATSSGGNVVRGRYKYPELRLRASSSEGSVLTDPRDAYFGVDTTYGSSRYDQSVIDVLRTKAEDTDSWDAVANLTEASWVFSLDDVKNVNVTADTYSGNYGVNGVYASGSRASGLSYTAHTGSANASTSGPASSSYQNVIDPVNGGVTAGWDQFTACLHGGTDGLKITERDPFNNTRDLSTTATNINKYAFNSINVAIDSLRDPEIVEYNLVSMPGIVNNTLNTKLVQMCEDRGDALAIIDLQNGYTPDTENGNSKADRKGNVDNVISNKRNTLRLNSSYGCAYYPWVQIRDTINGDMLWVPPSVVALGAMSYSEANSQLWFAPAGFTRGGLSVNRAGGIPVTGVEERLTSRDRDRLYEENINPIATFPAEGIVIFGQKTLQLDATALDRINVRRLVIYLKKQISRYAATILFDQNVAATWNRFKSKVVPFLTDVKAGLGITDYKLILDESTTTPDLIDRNIMYAKIYVKPARAIEYIAIDFIITDSGASFED